MSAPTFPTTIPPSMTAGSHEMHNYKSKMNFRSSPHTDPYITPYLGLRARLSQVWLNRWTILLLLILARTLIAIAGVNNDLDSARREALSACSDVESMGSAMASIPHYMSAGVNELAASGIEKAVQGLQEMTVLSVTAVEEIAVFIIGIMTNTYLCLITLAVDSSLQSVISVLEAAQDGLNKLTSALGNDITSTLQAFTSKYNSLVNSLKGIVIGSLSISPPSAPDFSQTITQLQNLQLPTGLDADLITLNNSLPTFDQVKNFTEGLIRFPFEEVKGLIQQHLGNYTFDRSVFPVPAKEQLSFCSDNDGIDEFFDGLVKVADIAKKIFIVVLLLAAIIACIPMAYREIRRWRLMQARAQLISTNDHAPMDVVYLVSRPYTSSAGLKMSNGFQTERRRNLIRWIVAYATSDAALFVLALGIAGLFSCLCQVILLKSLEKEVPALSNQVGAFADQVVAKLDNASVQWALATNAVIDSTNSDINTQMLGWVGTTTNAINSTLNAFVDNTTSILNSTFGGTPLYQPVSGIFNCLIELKVQGVQKALTWVHDNAHITIPQFPNNTFSVGAAASIAADNPNPDQSFLSSPGDAATDKISAAVARFVNALSDTIRTEAIISSIILAIWLLLVIIGIIRALSLWYGHDKTRGTGGAIVAYPPDTPITPMTDFRTNGQDRFVTVPLHEINNPRPITPAPRYSGIRERSGSNAHEHFSPKMGIAITTNNISSPPRQRSQQKEEPNWDPDNKL